MTRLLASLPSTFLGFIAAGVGVILVFSLSAGPPGGARHWTMTAVVVALMGVYGAFLWIRSRTPYATETDGETFYYLGFIYTLATLVAAFAPLLNSPARPESRHVLGLFGLGLITTFVGLAGRIVFAQTAPGLARPEDDARRLGEAYADAARAIEQSTVRIVHAQRRAEGHLSESYAEILTQFAATMERVSAGAEAAFERMARDVETRLGALRLPPTDIGEKLTAVLTDLTVRAEQLRLATVSVGAAYGELGDTLGEANRAWTEVVGVTDGASTSMARAGAALSSLERGTRAAEQSVLDWSGGLTKAGTGLHALTELTERAVHAQAELSAQISGPLAEQLRRHSEAAGALAERLQEDLRASEDAVRRVHHHLIDASRFILSKVDARR